MQSQRAIKSSMTHSRGYRPEFHPTPLTLRQDDTTSASLAPRSNDMGISHNFSRPIYPANALSVTHVHSESIEKSKRLAQPHFALQTIRPQKA